MTFAQYSLLFDAPQKDTPKLLPLNPSQQRAVEHDFGPMMVRAGAGTGKTTVLTRRIHRLVTEARAKPEEILAITYTNAAAEEMQDKLAAPDLLGSQAGDVQACTFHSYCHSVLRRRMPDMHLLCAEDIWVYFRTRIERLGLNYFAKAADPGTFLGALNSFFDRCNDELVSPTDYTAYVERLAADASLPVPAIKKPKKSAPDPTREQIIERCREIARIYATAQQMLATDNLGTYGSLIVNTARLFQTDPLILEQERATTKFILVDEFQDTNHSQLEIVRLLAGERGNLFVVGDPDQGIYRFRGASSGAFADFRRAYPETKAVTLERNQRSVQNVLDCAWSAISLNEDPSRSEPQFARKPLVSGRQERDASIANHPALLIKHKSNEQEAQEVARLIEERVQETGDAFKDFAILYRGHSAVSTIAAELAKKRIPFGVTGTNLLNTDIGGDLLAVLRCLITLDDDISLFRVALMPRWSLDAHALQDALSLPKRGTARVAAVLDSMEAGKEFLRTFRGMRDALPLEAPAHQLILRVAGDFGFGGSAEAHYLARFASEWQNKRGVGPRAGDDTLTPFLDYLDCWTEAGGVLKAEERDVLGARISKTEEPNAVQLMTVHAAKGLEFKHVFVVRVCSNSFPSSYREPLFEFPQALRKTIIENKTDKELQDAEERRLFYVAITRAKDTLALLGKCYWNSDKMPGKYLRELADCPSLHSKAIERTARPYIADVQAGASEAWHELRSRRERKLRLSATTIEHYDSCPKRYYFERVWNIPDEPGLALMFGSAIHNTLRSLLPPNATTPALTKDELLALFTSDFGQYKRIADDAHQFDLYLAQGIRYLSRFYQEEIENADSLPNVKAIEEWFEFELAGITITGRMDRVDSTPDGLVVLDYKTGNSKDEEAAKNSLQLSVYALAAKHKFGAPVAQVGFYNLETTQFISVPRTDDELRQAEKKIKKVADGIRAENFEPNPGLQCKWCGYSALCPAKREMLPQLASLATAH
ncbi:MAG: hypothetical protein NVS9B15_11360 [Acidobacteriaceae bacterium]